MRRWLRQLLVRWRAAWRAFNDPSLLDTPTPLVIVPEPPIRLVTVERPAPRLLEPLPYGRFRVYHHDPLTNTDRLIYPEWKGQDSGAEARRVFESFVLTYVGEYVKLMDGEAERGRRTGGQ
jgi:hypothetical protein